MAQPIDASQVVNKTGITSSYTYIYNCSTSNNLAIQAILTGGNGSITLAASADGTNFSPIPTASTVFTGPADVLFTILAPAYNWISLTVTRSTGTIAAVITINSKSNTIVSN